jgi:glycine/D-amino acid oxidase-like deaminating enzyme
MAKLKAANVPKDLDWIDADGVRAYEEMGGPDQTAQVHPYLFTTSMASLAEEAGVKIIFGSVKSIDKDASNSAVKSVTFATKDDPDTTKTIPADTVILSAGPWTPTVYPPAPISALRAHSVTIRPSRPVSAYALFTHITIPSSSAMNNTGITGMRKKVHSVTPEIYARPNNEVYACGEGDHLIPLPTGTDLVQVDDQRCQDIIDQVGSISDELRDGEVTARQACYLPNVTQGGGPMIGWTPGVSGLLMATGHTCWGIQNGPGTGKCVSELVWEGKVKSASIGSLDPSRFM